MSGGGAVPETWSSLQAQATAELARAGSPAPEAEARRLVAAASGYEAAELELHRSEHPTGVAAAALRRMVERRSAGEPLQYVVGGWGFRSLDLMVDRRVLIPRPETETVVDHALAAVDAASAAGVTRVRAADLGTGSGAIALALVSERSDVEVWATDVSSDALAVARANLGGAGRVSTRVRLEQGDWYDALPAELAGTLDLIVANPPYVAEHEPLPAEVEAWEPTIALRAGALGLDAIEVVVAGARTWLAPGGALVVEIGETQADAARRLATGAGLVEVAVHPDLAGRDRVLVACGPR